MYEQEAEIFGRYLLKRSPNNTVKVLYSKALESTPVTISKKDQKLLQFVLRNSWCIGLVDAGLAVSDSNSEVRRRLYIMFALLESSPEYCDYFLPKQRNPFYLFIVLLSGTRAVAKALLGSVLVKIIS